MNRWLSLIGCAAILALSLGCGSKELPPASKEDTPKVDQSIEDMATSGMPEEAKEQMRKNGYKVD
jgi:hypothetical protein